MAAYNLTSFMKALPSVDRSRTANPWLPPPLDIRVLVWNVNGKPKAKYRNALVPSVAGVIDADVMLLQEVMTKYKLFELIKRSCGNYRNWRSITAGIWWESCILYDANKFDHIDPYFNYRSLSDVFNSVLDIIFPFNENCKCFIRSRTSYAALHPKLWTIASQTPPYWSNVPTIFLSFHNVYNSEGTEIRDALAQGFCQMVQMIRNQTGCVVIAGADMNQVMEHPLILYYHPTPRRARRVYDHIIVAAPNRRVVINPVIAWNFIGAEQDPFNPLHGVMKNLLRPLYYGPSPTIDNYGQAVPHDPLVANFTLVHPSRCYT